MARAHANENQSWNQQDSTRHVSYPTVDFAIEESKDIYEYFEKIEFENRIFGALSDSFGVDVEDLSFLDFFCASYEATSDTLDSDDERSTMDRLEFHRDGSLLSFTILLSSPGEFEGGGTIFDALRDVTIVDDGHDSTDFPLLTIKPVGAIQPHKAGYATLHSGKLLHGGHVVTRGQRIVLVGFISVHERNVREGVLSEAAKQWGRNDVREFWNKRRLSLLTKQQLNEKRESMTQQQPKWEIKNWRYLSKQGSHFGPKSMVPLSVIKNIELRADSEKIRERRLRTEDGLLRRILLPREERSEKMSMEEGGWMEVDANNMPDGVILGWREDNDGADDMD